MIYDSCDLCQSTWWKLLLWTACYLGAEVVQVQVAVDVALAAEERLSLRG